MQQRIFQLRQDWTEGQTHALSQGSSAACRQTQSHLNDLKVLTMTMKLAKGELGLAMISP